MSEREVLRRTAAADAALAPIPVAEKLGVKATDKIRDAIMSGAYRPGRHLVVDDVARQLGVSSMPVREAMVALVDEGLLELLPHRGVAVGRITREDIADITAVHAYVAGLLAERAALVITALEVERLGIIQTGLSSAARQRNDANQRLRVGDLNYQFHRTINKMVDADRLVWLLRSVSSYVPRNVYADVSGWTKLAVHDHPGIIEALAKRDARRARTLTERHVTRSGEMVVDHLTTLGFWEMPASAGTARRTRTPRSRLRRE